VRGRRRCRDQADLRGEGRRAITISGDIGERETGERIAAETLKAFGKIDILVNNAGMRATCPVRSSIPMGA